ncbi:MAG TPA: hypothetical protein VKF41_01580 [Bryobacteraceae bacterium]|nr:hypothetical protein [Bryobacteraceae bacterium]
MKIFYKLLLSVSWLALAPGVFAQNSLNTPDNFNVSNVMTISAVGDGVLTTTSTLTAQQFAAWQNKYGQDQGLLRRDMDNNYTGQFDTSDWDVKIDSMNRVVTVSVKIMGAVIPRGGGVFEFRVPKQWQGGERNGATYSYNFADSQGGGVIAQTSVKLVLPDSASHFVEDKSETGERIIQYRVPAGGLSGILLWAGLAFVILGAAAAVVALAVLKDAPVPVPPPPPMHA